jgi:fatty acid desaturase
VTNEPLHWVEYALLHTVDVQHSWWCDWWMGYLNYQIEHHLFPTMPDFRLRAIVPRVRALAQMHMAFLINASRTETQWPRHFGI